MICRRVLLLALSLSIVPIGAFADAAFAQQPLTTFEVTRPGANGAEAGRTLVVEGTARLPTGCHLWVFARRTDFEPMWWPQHRVVVDPETGKWSVEITLGEPRDVGRFFDVAVGVFGEEAHLKLSAYYVNAMKTGDWLPIEMPEVAAPPRLFRVKKVSDD